MKNLKNILESTKKLNILYVEDDKLVQASSVEMFSNFFGSVTCADNGEEALALYNANKFDLLITDLSMPKMDGIELISNIRKENKNLPIIVFSAWNNPSSLNSCISLNIDGYMLKPLNSDNLVDAIYKISLKLKNDRELFKREFDIDKLTQLKSHNALMEEMQDLSYSEIPVMILINIDDFHIYNEIYGLDVGDKILSAFAKQLDIFNSKLSYHLYRMSGDEFVLFEKVKALDTDKYTEDINRLFDFIENSQIKIDGVQESISIRITVGIAFHNDNIYGRADMALHEARRRGRNYLGFTADADRREELKKNLYWREEINRAVADNRVHTYYQPIVDINKNILKYEALIRIQQVEDDGKLTLVSPKEFIDFSKISKQYIALTKIVIEESFATMIEKNVHVAINITFHDIENREINRLLHEKISKHSIAAKTKFDISSQVIFELLEHQNHEDYDRFIEFIDEFKALGVVITIDNFGLGFANMSKISAMAPDYVKIDSTLMKNIDNDKHAYSLVKAIVKFAKEL
ncbi:MAG: EAL domain-containing protein, partial [Campylobacterota bacterium]